MEEKGADDGGKEEIWRSEGDVEGSEGWVVGVEWSTLVHKTLTDSEFSRWEEDVLGPRW